MDAGRLYEPSGILPGALSPPVILLASFFSIFKFYFLIVALVCCSFFSGLGHRYPELQGLECSLVDRDPGTELRPGMAHDLELSCDGLKLWS